MILGRHSTMDIRSIHLGGLFHAEEEIQMTSTMANFVGQMQGFVYNGNRFIDLVKSLGPELAALPMTTFKLTARFVNSPPGNPYHASTFRSKHSYVGLAMLKAYSNTNIDFRFKTLEANGLLFFNGGRRSDFIAVELVNGHIHYIFDLGDGPITLRDKSRVHMNDNRWHSVSIRRPGPKTHTLVVDDTIEVYNAPGNNMHMELEGILYVGGVFKDMYTKLPASVASRNGFEGCLASVDLADVSPSLTDDAVVPSSLVISGCEGPTKCSQNACANRGVCVQQWNAYACECDMTSYTGPTCYDESVAYEFGANKGMIQYTFPAGKQPDTEEDAIALGFITTKPDAVLLRIESSTTQDYMELEIVEGNIFMVYNIGSNDLPLGEIGTKVNDNTYHVVRFQRFGGNATLQLDDYNVQTVHPQGHQSTVFNSMANIQVGGKLARNGRFRIERPFTGVIAGLTVNRLRMLDLAAERDPHVTTRGDVQLVTGVLDRNDLQRMQQTPASGYSGVMDDLIFSGAGSGCRGDDEDECTPPFESGSGDDLITPVYVPPTKQPTTPQKGEKETGGTERTCDDEDCVHGSGDSGEVTETFTSTTSKGGDPTEHSSSTITETAKRTDGTSTEQETAGTTIDFSTTSIGTSSSSGTSSSRTTPAITTTNSGTTWSSTTQQQPNFETTVPDQETVHPHYPTTPEQERTHPPYVETDPPLPEPEPPYHPPPPYTPTYTPTRPKNNKNNRVSSEAEERTAMIIGIVSGALIAVVLVILLLLWLKSTGDRTYKNEHDKVGGYGQGPNAALLGSNTGTNSSHHHHHHQQTNGATVPLNGSLRNGNGDKSQMNVSGGLQLQKPKKRDSKDIKEWYV